MRAKPLLPVVDEPAVIGLVWEETKTRLRRPASRLLAIPFGIFQCTEQPNW